MIQDTQRADWLKVMTALYQQLDAQIAERARQLPLACRRGCATCCIDGLSVFQCEAQFILHHCRLPAETQPNANQCAFLDPETQACRIYPFRPYVCRSHGLVLQWHDDDGTQKRETCHLNVDIDVAAVPPEIVWPIGPVESHLARVEKFFFPDYNGERMSMREIFHRSLAPPS